MSNNQSEGTNQVEQERGRRKTRVGTVVSDKMDKTIVVMVERRYAHPLYGKQVTRSKKYHAHDETNDANIGDTVRIMETRPLSKLKRWRVAEVVERAK
jgi:small subunit ribosomal protein S17